MPYINICQITPTCILAIITSRPLDFNKIKVFLKICRLLLIPLRFKLAFYVSLLNFYVNPKRFSQNQKGKRTKYFAKISWFLELNLWDLHRKVKNFTMNILVMDRSIEDETKSLKKLKIRFQSSDSLIKKRLKFIVHKFYKIKLEIRKLIKKVWTLIKNPIFNFFYFSVYLHI